PRWRWRPWPQQRPSAPEAVVRRDPSGRTPAGLAALQLVIQTLQGQSGLDIGVLDPAGRHRENLPGIDEFPGRPGGDRVELLDHAGPLVVRAGVAVADQVVPRPDARTGLRGGLLGRTEEGRS